VIDIRARRVVAQVTNVGIETYGVTIFEGSD